MGLLPLSIASPVRTYSQWQSSWLQAEILVEAGTSIKAQSTRERRASEASTGKQIRAPLGLTIRKKEVSAGGITDPGKSCEESPLKERRKDM